MPSQTQDSSAEAVARDLERGERLKDHIAIVTGSDSGIGRAIAIAFARQGADVAVSYHTDEQGAQDTRRQVEEAGRKSFLDQLDQTDPRAVSDYFTRVKSELGVPTLLVNNAGVDATGKHVKDMALDDMERGMRTNFYGPFYFCREFVRALDETGKKGVIINVTTIHQEYPRAGAASYDCSKGALRNLTRTLALEVSEKGTRVVNLAPGMVLTPFNQKAIEDEETLRKQTSMIPMKRAAEPEEIARAAVFLASEEASYVTGTTLFVDGALGMMQAQGA